MRILICSNACPPHFVGGAELMAHEQAKALAGLGHDVRVFAADLAAPRPRHARLDDYYEGILFHRIATVPEDYSPEYLNFLHPRVDAHFHDVLHGFRPDIIHCHNLLGLSAKLPVIGKQFGAHVVCTLHDFWGFCLRNTAVRADGQSCDDVSQCRVCLPRLHDGRALHIPLRFRKDFMRLALDHVDRFVTPSQHVANRYVWAGLDAGRIAVIPNGIDVTRFRPSLHTPSSDTIRLTYVGYFGAHKGVTTLLEAVAQLSDRRVVLQLVGEGPERGAYLSQIQALGLEDRVRLLGKVSPVDMPSVYAQSDVVVLPSIWEENQPVCLMEAMAAGVAVVASNKGGIPELVSHGENGFLFAAGDARGLAAQLQWLMADPALREAMGGKGRNRVEKLDHADQARRLLALYDEVLNMPTQAGPARDVFGAVGNLRRKLAEEGRVLADERQQTRYFMPPGWIADCTSGFASPGFSGVMLTGRFWQILRFVRINAIAHFPRRLRLLGTAVLTRRSE